MAQNNFLSWVGFKSEAENKTAPTQNALDRIRELERQLSDLRARRDITGLSREEFEILATETAMTMIKSAQQREAKANSDAQKIIIETNRSTKEKLESAESKAQSILSQAESRGRKYISVAENDANELLNKSIKDASNITSAAQRDASKLIADAAKSIVGYRSWLSSAILEAERLHKAQNSSLNAAEQAIKESREKLRHTFNRLAALQADLNANLDGHDNPTGKVFVAGAGKKIARAAAKRKNVANRKNSSDKKKPQ
jgi:vacuolar-type H+-ATPase subunit H